MKPRSTAKRAGRPKAARRSPNVPHTFRGFSLQETRLVVHLLRAKAGDAVCLEVIDDVGIEHSDGTVTAEQDKSNAGSNPLAQRSVEFWKTLRNWADAVAAGRLDVDRTRFVIYVSHKAGGPIAKSFAAANSLDDALSALRLAKSSLLDPARPPGAELHEHLDVVFAPDCESAVATIVSRMAIEVGSGDPAEELRSACCEKFVSPEFVDELVRWCLGWVKVEVDGALNTGRPPRIECDLFHAAATNFLRAHDRTTILRSVGAEPSEAEVQEEVGLRRYVRQLHLIDMEEEDVLEAVNDFLRAASDRTHWARQGLITEDSIDAFSKDLRRSWRGERDTIEITHGDKELNQRGRLLYRTCMGREQKLDRLEVPSHFTRGSLHALADDLVVGWHPGYRDRLK